MLIQNKPITTMNKVISIKGKVLYNDRRRRIDVKRPIRDLFEHTDSIGYVMELCMSEATMLERVKELSKQEVMPVILYFTK